MVLINFTYIHPFCFGFRLFAHCKKDNEQLHLTNNLLNYSCISLTPSVAEISHKNSP